MEHYLLKNKEDLSCYIAYLGQETVQKGTPSKS